MARGGGRRRRGPHRPPTPDHGAGTRGAPQQEHRCRSWHQPTHGREPSCRDHEANRDAVAAGLGPAGACRRRPPGDSALALPWHLSRSRGGSVSDWDSAERLLCPVLSRSETIFDRWLISVSCSDGPQHTAALGTHSTTGPLGRMVRSGHTSPSVSGSAATINCTTPSAVRAGTTRLTLPPNCPHSTTRIRSGCGPSWTGLRTRSE